MRKRPGFIKFAGMERTVVGDDMQVGGRAPDFLIQKNDWSLSKAFKETKRKVRIIASMPSLDTSTCDRETRRFNEEAANLDKDIILMVVTMDLPAAQKRWCAAADVNRVMTVSDVYKADFGKKYGTLMEEVRLLRRAIFIVDKERIVRYVAYMTSNSDEPNYDEVLAAAKATLIN